MNIISYTLKHGSSEKASARIGETYSTRTKAKSFSLQSRGGNRPLGKAEASISWPGTPSSYLQSSNMEILVEIPRKVTFAAVLELGATQRRGSLVQTKSLISPTTPTTSVASAQPPRRIEVRYRSSINDQFSNLRQTLPGKIIAGASTSESGKRGEKSVSKMETLALAMTHIRNLEMEGK